MKTYAGVDIVEVSGRGKIAIIVYSSYEKEPCIGEFIKINNKYCMVKGIETTSSDKTSGICFAELTTGEKNND